jgi:small redox-active disulfide protein 2
MKIEVCGSGCSKCAELEKRASEAVVRAGIAAVVEHTYDMNKIIARGILLTPALVVDGKVVVSGKIPGVDQIAEMLKKAASGV